MDAFAEFLELDNLLGNEAHWDSDVFIQVNCGKVDFVRYHGVQEYFYRLEVRCDGRSIVRVVDFGQLRSWRACKWG